MGRLIIFFLALGLLSCIDNQKIILELEVQPSQHDRWNTPVTVSIGVSHKLPGSKKLALFETTGGERTQLDVQLIPGQEARLSWIMPGITKAGEERRFELYETDSKKTGIKKVQCSESGSVLEISLQDSQVLQYWFERKAPPEGVAECYGRSAFIHPLSTPSGAVLTRIQPPDHYHHYGIWNPWTHTNFRGDVLDFWNLAKEEATVRTKEVTHIVNGDVFGGFEAIHEHVVFPEDESAKEIIALQEEWDVKAWSLPEPAKNGWIIDFFSEMQCATDSPFTIIQYRYQGFGFRGRADWNDENCVLLTSEGKNKADGNATRARWCNIQGPTEIGRSGVLFMTHPDNHDFPELLRIWPLGANDGIENVFFNFNPAQDKDWQLEPGEKYLLKYRMYVYDGDIDVEKAEMLWHDFAQPPSVLLKR